MQGLFLCPDQADVTTSDVSDGVQNRKTTIINEPWFVHNDVCNACAMTNARRVKTRLEQEDVTSSYVLAADGKSYPTTVINEAGLYDVILDSRKPQAKRFRRWVNQFQRLQQR